MYELDHAFGLNTLNFITAICLCVFRLRETTQGWVLWGKITLLLVMLFQGRNAFRRYLHIMFEQQGQRKELNQTFEIADDVHVRTCLFCSSLSSLSHST